MSPDATRIVLARHSPRSIALSLSRSTLIARRWSFGRLRRRGSHAVGKCSERMAQNNECGLVSAESWKTLPRKITDQGTGPARRASPLRLSLLSRDFPRDFVPAWPKCTPGFPARCATACRDAHERCPTGPPLFCARCRSGVTSVSRHVSLASDPQQTPHAMARDTLP